MKNLISYVLAGVIGGCTFYGIQSYTTPNNNTIATEIASPRPIYTSNASGNVSTTPFDFVAACERSTSAVVEIAAAESEQFANQRMQRSKPSNDFFNFDFGQLFGEGMFGPKQGSGSGVMISPDGYIVTNNHVVGFADELKVTLANGKEYEATKIGTDPSSDLAIIKIEGDGFDYLPFANSDDVKVGQWVLAIGNPFNYLASTVTAGIVSALGRDIDIIKGSKTIEEFIQTDAAVNPGNSGGALVDKDGNLIGINTAIATPTGVYAGYSFAIPSNLAKRITDDIIANGNIERANLGIAGYDIDEELSKQEKLTVTKGVYVAEVVPGSGAQFAGILPGDVVVELDGQAVNAFEDMRNYMRFSKVGDTVKLKIIRNGKQETVSVKIIKTI
jgi:serine protease Do